jgi:dipeptidyl aminopeptidase/acylaminoacyl peptidase
VHGGPWARDSWEFSPWHQWLASRGYAVLSVNFRGSSGFGKSFQRAGYLEWGGKMQQDLADAVKWAVDQKIADKSKIAIMGEDYGGYAALLGLEAKASPFACGIDIAGPIDLAAFVQAPTSPGQPSVDELVRRVGDFNTDDGKKLLGDRSPANRLGAIRKPILIAQGKDDPRVSEADVGQMAERLKSKKVAATYVVYTDEAHGLSRPKNRTSFAAIADIFLSQCLGGPYEPIGKDLGGSSVSVPVGAQYIHGLRDALGMKKK